VAVLMWVLVSADLVGAGLVSADLVWAGVLRWRGGGWFCCRVWLRLAWVGFEYGAWLCVGGFGHGRGVGLMDEPESLILAQSERWRHA